MAVDDSNHINKQKQKLTEKLDRLNEKKRNINIQIRQTRRALRNLNNQKPKVKVGRFEEASTSISSVESSVSSPSLSRSKKSKNSKPQSKNKTSKQKPIIVTDKQGKKWEKILRKDGKKYFLLKKSTPKNSNRKTRKKSK